MNILSLFAESVKINPNEAGIPEISASEVLVNSLNIFYMVAGIAAVIMIIVASIMYVVSRGEPAAVTKAKNTIVYAVAGLVVIIAAFAITWFVIGRFQ